MEKRNFFARTDAMLHQLTKGLSADFAAEGKATDRVGVEKNKMIVQGSTDVELNHVHTDFDRLLNRSDRIFPEMGGCAPMSNAQKSFLGHL